MRHSEIIAPVTVTVGQDADVATLDLTGLNPDEITGGRIGYFPEFEVIALRPSQQADMNGVVFGWELVCEEV
jgi:hypothetical protein